MAGGKVGVLGSISGDDCCLLSLTQHIVGKGVARSMDLSEWKCAKVEANWRETIWCDGELVRRGETPS